MKTLPKGFKVLNLMINKEDLLNNVKLWKIRISRQQAKQIIGNPLRLILLKKGLAHSFFKEYMWLCPINNDKLNNEIIKNILKEFSFRQEKIESEVIKSLTEVNVWYPLGIVLIRDALSYSLMKLKNNDLVIFALKREVYLKKFISSGIYSGVTIGISLNRIFRINGNICICPTLVYECFDSSYRRVEDPRERSKHLSLVSKITSKEYEQRMNTLIKRISPLVVHLSNKRLIFNEWQYKLLKRGETTLEEWL
ncbi:MAG: hypothetical protein QXY96_06415 [Candidatus Methanomethylicaceae archaeon]